jgi:hypothetical protein
MDYEKLVIFTMGLSIITNLMIMVIFALNPKVIDKPTVIFIGFNLAISLPIWVRIKMPKEGVSL